MGLENFISFTSIGRVMFCMDLLRLRLNVDMSDVMDSIKNCALIRELHVYGNHTCIGKKLRTGLNIWV